MTEKQRAIITELCYQYLYYKKRDKSFQMGMYDRSYIYQSGVFIGALMILGLELDETSEYCTVCDEHGQICLRVDIAQFNKE